MDIKHAILPFEVFDYSPDEKLVAIADVRNKNGNVQIYDENKQPIANFKYGAPVQTIDYSPDGRLLAAGGQTGEVKIWDTQNWEIIKTLKGDSELIRAVKFSPNPDNPILASAGSNDIIKLWNYRNWQLHGTIMTTEEVEGLAFSENGDVLASAGSYYKVNFSGETITTSHYKTVSLWATHNGLHITTLKEHTDRVRSVDFSSDGTTIASFDDKTLRLWDVAPYLTPLQLKRASKVKLIYFVPQDRQPQAHIWEKLDEFIRKVQKFYADEMDRHGFGKKTFDFEKDENGEAVIYRLNGEHTDAHYLEGTTDKVLEEINEQFNTSLDSQDIYLVAVDISSNKIGEVTGYAPNMRFGLEDPIYYALVPTSGRGFSFYTIAHELGHPFGLSHDFSDSTDGSDIMSYDRISPYRLSKQAANWLDKSHLFNDNPIFFNTPPKLEGDRTDIKHLEFKVEDRNGLHQIQLEVPTPFNEMVTILERQSQAIPNAKQEQLSNMEPAAIDIIVETIEDRDKKQEILSKLSRDLDDKTLDLLAASIPDWVWKKLWKELAKKKANKTSGWKLHDWQSLNGKKTDIVEFELPDASIKQVMISIIDMFGNIAVEVFDLSEDSAQPAEKP